MLSLIYFDVFFLSRDGNSPKIFKACFIWRGFLYPICNYILSIGVDCSQLGVTRVAQLLYMNMPMVLCSGIKNHIELK